MVPAVGLAVFLDVRDQQDLTAPGSARLAQMDLDAAQLFGEGDEPVLVETLIVKDQHFVGEPGGFDRVGLGGGKRGEVDARNFADKGFRQPARAEGHHDPPEA
jgi:hypothetical protein